MRTLLLLHGATGAKDQLEVLEKTLSENYSVHTFNFSGHGGKPMEAEFSIEQFAQEVLAFLDELEIEKVSIFGYSMGGYVALYLARNYPQKIEAVITLGTKLLWNSEIAEAEAKMLQPNIIGLKVPKYAAQLQQRHAPGDWKLLLDKTASMLKSMGETNPISSQDFKQIECKVLLIKGDKDTMVSFEETLDVYKDLPNSQLAILPATPHPIEKVNAGYLSLLIKDFLAH